MKSNACGVDFGTSNSTVGWLRSDAPTLLPLEDGKVTLPSVIFFHAEDPLVSYGRAALTDYLAGYEGRLMRSLKSLLGSSLLDERHGANRTMYVRTAALVTNLGVHFKLGRENSLAWVTTLDKGSPVAGAQVRVSDCRGKEVATVHMDSAGVRPDGVGDGVDDVTPQHHGVVVEQ